MFHTTLVRPYLFFFTLSLLAPFSQAQTGDPVSPTDLKVEAQIKQAFNEHPILDGQQIIVLVEDNTLYLSGHANSFYTADVAESLARKTGSFTRVINTIRMKDDIGSDSDWEIKNQLINGLYWSPYIEPQSIRIDVKKGNVILSGEVSSRLASFFAHKEAIEAGARTVENRLRIVPQ